MQFIMYKNDLDTDTKEAYFKVYRDFIDCAVVLRKFQAENSNATRDEKECEKIYADLVGSVMKMVMKPANTEHSFNFSLDYIKYLKDISREYSLQRLIAFPALNSNGGISWMLTPKGGDARAFFNALGTPHRLNNSPEIKVQLDRAVKNYGIVIYDSNM
ncbi:MAG: hypothetical protein IJB09_05410 [Oscillospiraceae bacterium]|nr:hypothetical protein [Oscillospiraceae bacterium]